MTQQHSTGDAGGAAASVGHWLVCGGDERIALDGESRRNRYGCTSAPEPCAAAFGSATASTISPEAFAAAGACLERLLARPSMLAAYHEGAARVRERLAALCGLPAGAADAIVLGASGTDLHLIAADLARACGPAPLISVMGEPRETGRGVSDALRGLRHSSAPPHGATAVRGQPLASAPAGGLIAIPLREPDGRVRPAEHVDRAFEAACAKAVAGAGRALLVLFDVSKTGLLAPSPDCAVRLKRRFGEALTVLVDACQFRLSAEAVRRYLEADFLVAATGSKFVGGPPFSAALLLPQRSIARLWGAPLTPSLGDYSARADWPPAFVGRAVLPDAPNLGLLLRWEAALHELEAFQRLPPEAVRDVLRTVGRAVGRRLEGPGAFEALGAGEIGRFGQDGWDAQPSIFPFLVRTPRGLLTGDQTQALYEALREPDPTGGAPRIVLGQPVAVGCRDGRPVSALRLALSARQLVAAVGRGDGGAELVGRIGRTLDAIEARAAAMP